MNWKRVILGSVFVLVVGSAVAWLVDIVFNEPSNVGSFTGVATVFGFFIGMEYGRYYERRKQAEQHA